MAAKKEASSKATKVNRDEAATQVILAMTGTSTMSELTKLADDLFVGGAEGRESNLVIQRQSVRRVLGTLETAGLVKQTKPTDTIVERLVKK